MKARLQYWFVLWVVLFSAAALVLQQSQPQPYPVTVLDWIRLLMVSAWLVPLPMAVIGLWGLVRYHNRIVRYKLRVPLIIRIVTKGDNLEAVKQTITAAKLATVGLPVEIQVVTDKPLGIKEQIVVPKNYTTSNGAMWKARALNYAIEVGGLSDKAWILHLDEESHITTETVAGVAEFIATHPGTVGQGAILYNRELATNPWWTLADSLRTGDDVGRFYGQYKAGNCRFGMHGSFILIPQKIEQAIGFNFPPQLCVTEDAYFGLLALDMGFKFGWVNGYIYEQSPRSAKDFLKQRRRWYLGIRKLVFSDLPFKTKSTLLFSFFAWSGSILVLLATLINFFAPIYVPQSIRIGADLSLAIYIGLYLVGLHLNLAGQKRKVLYYLVCLISIPVFSLLEVAAVIYGIIRPQLNFEVIKK